ncbi:MAG: acyltransferase [Candidatus Korobacteraceae bacterium]
MGSFVLKLRRGETPFYRRLRQLAHNVRASNLPLPRFFNPVLRAGYHTIHNLELAIRWALAYFIFEPLFRGRCESVGKRFRCSRLPWVVGQAKIYIGDDVNFFGKVDIHSGSQIDEPRLVLKDRVDIGHNVLFMVSREIVLEEDVNVASGVRFMDSDAHPRDTMARIADLPATPDEIKAVRIKRYAWIGHNAFIMKGVTVGEGAIVGVNSVVLSDIPDYSVAIGNPARVIVKNINRTAATAASGGSEAAPEVSK